MYEVWLMYFRYDMIIQEIYMNIYIYIFDVNSFDSCCEQRQIVNPRSFASSWRMRFSALGADMVYAEGLAGLNESRLMTGETKQAHFPRGGKRISLSSIGLWWCFLPKVAPKGFECQR